jgi:outer membrane protein/protease secretion system outer membrane protein
MFDFFRIPRVLIVASVLAGNAFTCFGMDVMQAYKLAMENDRQLRAAQAQYLAGAEALPQAKSRLYPSLALSNSRLAVSQDRKDGETQYQNQRYSSQSDSLSLRQPIYNPRLWALKDQAVASVASAAASLSGEQQNLAVRLTETYLNVLSARERDTLVRSQIKLTESRLVGAQKSFAAGVGIRTDIDEIQAQLDILQAQALQATHTIFTATSELEMLTGKPIEKFFVINKQTFQPEKLEPGSLDNWLTHALNRNNEVRFRAAQRDALVAALVSVHAEDLPTLDGVAQIIRNSGENAYFVNSKTENRSVGVQLNIPLYQGGWFSSRQRQALANLTEGQEMLDRAEMMAKNEVRKTYFLLRESLMRVAALEKANSSAQTVVIANKKSFQAGVRTTLDVLAAEQRVVQVAVDLVETRAQSLNAWMRLKALTSDVDETTFSLLSLQIKPE